MFDSFEAYPWFLKVHPYENPAQLLADLKDRVIGPLEAEVAKLALTCCLARWSSANLTKGNEPMKTALIIGARTEALPSAATPEREAHGRTRPPSRQP